MKVQSNIQIEDIVIKSFDLSESFLMYTFFKYPSGIQKFSHYKILRTIFTK